MSNELFVRQNLKLITWIFTKEDFWVWAQAEVSKFTVLIMVEK